MQLCILNWSFYICLFLSVCSACTGIPGPFSIPIEKRRSKMQWDTRNLMQMNASDVDLSDYFNNEYVGLLGVGSPPQYLTVVFDTGSSDIWIPGRSCKSCGAHNSFDDTLSSTFELSKGKHNKPASFVISYGSGSVEGSIGLDTVTLSAMSLTKVKVGIVTKEDSAIADFDMDGIVGLAFDGLSSVTTPNILDEMAHTYANLSESFAIYLSSDPDDHTKPSVVTFGGYDLSIVSPNATFHYAPVVRDGPDFTYWMISMKSFAISTSFQFSSLEETKVAYSFCGKG